jgi:hypothetical protein
MRVSDAEQNFGEDVRQWIPHRDRGHRQVGRRSSRLPWTSWAFQVPIRVFQRKHFSVFHRKNISVFQLKPSRKTCFCFPENRNAPIKLAGKLFPVFQRKHCSVFHRKNIDRNCDVLPKTSNIHSPRMVLLHGGGADDNGKRRERASETGRYSSKINESGLCPWCVLFSLLCMVTWLQS